MMKLSAPVYALKRQARQISRRERIPLHQALDRIAAAEGFRSWAQLAERHADQALAARLYPALRAGELVIVAARPGQGKTLLGLELAVEAMKQGRKAVFFTLEYTQAQMLDRFRAIGVDPFAFDGRFDLDMSDGICASHIMERLAGAEAGALAVIDYLQLLDQRRETPPLMDQVRALKDFALRQNVVLVFLSQVRRDFEASGKALPDLEDVRLPNPLDLSLFTRAAFLQEGQMVCRSL